MLKSNCVAIHLHDITAAENFYTNVMKFKLLIRTNTYLEYDAGRFLLCIDEDLKQKPPIPSFTVENITTTRRSLLRGGCTILREDTNSIYFCDSFGIIYDVMQG